MYDEKVLVGLDFVLHQASLRGLRAVLVLANYWGMYGGIDHYNIWSFEAGSGVCCSYCSSVVAKLLLVTFTLMKLVFKRKQATRILRRKISSLQLRLN